MGFRVGLFRVLLLVSLFGCSPQEGTQIFSHSFPSVEVAPYSEIYNVCQSWTLNNDKPVYVNTVSMEAGAGWHHSNWFFVPDHLFDGPDGTWDCADRYFDELVGAVNGGVLFAQSTKSTHDVQQFVPGAAMELPAGVRIVGSIHILNAFEETLVTSADLELTALPKSQLEVPLFPIAFDYRPLDIPSQTASRFTGECPMSELNGGPLDFNMYYVLPHYHELGAGMRLEAFGGPDGDLEIFDTRSKVGEPLGQSYSPPINLAGATGLRFSCDYLNTTDRDVDWGLGDGEMCMLLGYTDSPHLWYGIVPSGNNFIGVDSEGVRENEGSCTVYQP